MQGTSRGGDLGKYGDDGHHARQLLHERHILGFEGIRRDEVQAHVHTGVLHVYETRHSVGVLLGAQPLLHLVVDVLQDGAFSLRVVQARRLLQSPHVVCCLPHPWLLCVQSAIPWVIC